MRRSYSPSRELIPANPHPVFGHLHVGGRLGVDAQAERRSPDEVGDEAHLAAVPREQPRARSFEPLAGAQDRVRRQLELGLQEAVRPGDARHFSHRRFAEAKVDDGRRNHLLLGVKARAHLDLAADAERVDALIAGRRHRARPQCLPAILLLPFHPDDARALIAAADQLEAAVAVEIRG